MRYVRIEHDGSGGSRSVDVDVDLREQPFAAGVPPLLVSAPMLSEAVVFVEFPDDVRDTDPHPAPRRQIGAVLSGVAETTTTDGEVRRFPPGSVVLLEDTEGRGHVTRIVETPFSIMFVPLDGPS
jgi:hypothetical protein